jgi:hypothetical protein
MEDEHEDEDEKSLRKGEILNNRKASWDLS